jgi:rubrerythrin
MLTTFKQINDSFVFSNEKEKPGSQQFLKLQDFGNNVIRFVYHDTNITMSLIIKKNLFCKFSEENTYYFIGNLLDNRKIAFRLDIDKKFMQLLLYTYRAAFISMPIHFKEDIGKKLIEVLSQLTKEENMLTKYGVKESKKYTKGKKITKCPACGRELRKQAILICPKCGTEPFEEKLDDHEENEPEQLELPFDEIDEDNEQ